MDFVIDSQQLGSVPVRKKEYCNKKAKEIRSVIHAHIPAKLGGPNE